MTLAGNWTSVFLLVSPYSVSVLDIHALFHSEGRSSVFLHMAAPHYCSVSVHMWSGRRRASIGICLPLLGPSALWQVGQCGALLSL